MLCYFAKGTLPNSYHHLSWIHSVVCVPFHVSFFFDTPIQLTYQTAAFHLSDARGFFLKEHPNLPIDNQLQLAFPGVTGFQNTYLAYLLLRQSVTRDTTMPEAFEGLHGDLIVELADYSTTGDVLVCRLVSKAMKD